MKITTTMPLTSGSVVKRAAGLMSTRVDNDLFVLNPRRENYIGLDEIGRQIWDSLEAPTGVDQLCRQVTQQYQGDLLQIPADLIEFLNELVGEGLLELQ